MDRLKKCKQLLFVMVFIWYSCGTQKDIEEKHKIYQVINEFLAIGSSKETHRIYKFSVNYNKEKKNWSSYLNTKLAECHVNYTLYSKIQQEYKKEIGNPGLTPRQIKDIEKRYRDKIFVKTNSLLADEDVIFMKSQNNNNVVEWDKSKLNEDVKLINNLSNSYALSIPYFSKDNNTAILFKSSEKETVAFLFIKKAGKWEYFCRSDIRIIFVDQELQHHQ